MPAGATRGADCGGGAGREWTCLDVNREDPVEMALAADLQRLALAKVSVSSRGKYTGQFNTFVAWCEALSVTRASLPASEATFAFYLQSVMNRAKKIAPVKAASSAIAFFQKINLFDHDLTQAPAVCLVRGAATKKFGLTLKNPKEPFEWAHAVSFAEAYGVRH